MDGTWGEREGGRRGMPLLEGYGVSTRIGDSGYGPGFENGQKNCSQPSGSIGVNCC